MNIMAMKLKYLLILLSSAMWFNQAFTQCPGTHTDVCFYDSIFLFVNPTECFPSGTCDASLEKGFIVISVEDSVVLGAIDGNVINFNDYEGCIVVVPICYDLNAIRIFVDAMLNFNVLYPFCCTAMNTEIMGLCDSVKARYNSSNEIVGLNDLIGVFGSDTVKAGSLQESIDSFNANIMDIESWCGPQIEPIRYCSDSVDFINGPNIYEIDAFCPFPDCLDSMNISAAYLANDPHQSIFKAKQVIHIEGNVTATEMIELRTENEVIINPGFSTFSNSTFEVAVEPCVPAPAPPLIEPKKRR